MTTPLCVHGVLVAVLLAVPCSTQGADAPRSEEPQKIDFDRDVKPILAKRCASCHGAEKPKNGLRLDRKADAMGVIVPGKPAESLLFQLVSGQDKDRPMPPKGALPEAELATLKAWIEGGAKWPDDGSTAQAVSDWWSFKPVKKPTVPETPNTKHQTRNAIDSFILAELAKQKLTPSPEADRRTLVRRLYFDLIGLPPSPEEVEAFAKDDSPDAYEKLVDKLLASPQYGERWARHWLDVVHFGETHGYDKDKPRPNAWPYRDYVIRALNADKPYARFVQEQIAGDVLFPGTVDGVEALGFLAAGPWDFIGHVELPETKIDGKVARHLDRDDFVSNTIGTFMGLTVHCAQCHNHKFDPIAQEDYYRLQAVFAAIDRTDRRYDRDPKIAAERAELEAKKKAASDRAEQLRAAARKKAGEEYAALDKEIRDGSRTRGEKPAEHGYHSQIARRQTITKWVQVDLGEAAKLDRIVLRPCHDDYNNIGAGFGFPVRFKIELSDDAKFANSVVVADETAEDYLNPATSPYVARLEGKTGRYIRVTATKLALRDRDYIFALAELEALDADGKNLAADKEVTALDSIEAGQLWGKRNLTDSKFPPAPRLAPAEIAKLTAKRDTLYNAALGEEGQAKLAELAKQQTDVDAALRKFPRQQTTYVGAVHNGSGAFAGTGASGGKPRPVYVLSRGDVTKPGKEVSPGAIATIPGINGRFELPANHTEGDRRAALAKWLTSRDNPLTWRVMANRVWQYHFGRGLVDTPNDFGKMGTLPTHPELLDYLASELREHQSLKKLHKLIVMSATYRQVSTSNDANAKTDADNRYLWRQNRRKLEAEAVRDAILSVAGKLDLTMGGPSFQDFVIEKPEHSPHYQYNLHDPEDAKSHRRAVYRFVVRSQQQPFMAALDCADPSLAVEKRNQTLTPQQALAMLNNKLAIAMAKHFAERVEKLGATDAEHVSAAVRLAFGREPTAQERDALAAYAKEHGLANACRVVLNLNEFVFVD